MEYGILFKLTPPGLDPIYFNDFAGTYSQSALLILSAANGFEAESLRRTLRPAPSRDGGFVFPAKRDTSFPALVGSIAADNASGAFEWEQKLRAAEEAMHGAWGLLEWTNSDGVTRNSRVASQSLTIQGSIPKAFSLVMVSDQPCKYGDTLHTDTLHAGDTHTLVNGGDKEVWPFVRFVGGFSGLTLASSETGVSIVLSSALVATDDFVDADAILDSLMQNDLQSVDGYMDFSGDFFPLLKGNNTLTLSFTDADGTPSATVYWRDGWA